MAKAAAAILVLAASLTITKAKDSPDFQHFVTEPNFEVVTVDVLTDKRKAEQAPGYIFLAPYQSRTGWGPQIFDTSGNLVWNGADDVKIRAIDFQPCFFNSTVRDHLCYNDAVPLRSEQAGHSVGVIRFFNNNYTQAGKDYEAAGHLRGPDIHELNTPPTTQGRTFLRDIFQPRQWDLSPYKGPKKGYILDGCFQEIDLISRKVVFQWCSLDHTDIDITYIYLGFGNYTIQPIAGRGEKEAPWDYFHINAVDKSSSGNYIVSSRHANSILHVAGPNNTDGFKPGKVIWYLGGKFNSFDLKDGLNFSAQHTVRYHRDKTPTGMEITLLDNASEGKTHTSDMSQGKLISLDTLQMQASLVSTFSQPSGYIVHNQGNVQMLPNGNGFVGWGHCNYFSEHDATGKLLYYAQFGGKGDCDKGRKDSSFAVFSFRAWKFPWKGYPVSRPKIAAFSRSCGDEMHVFLSWNGATEVSKWSIYGSNSSNPRKDTDSFKHIATVPKDGFETKATTHFSLYVYAEPLNENGDTMSFSSLAKAFVPSKASKCKEARCMNHHDVSSKKDSIADSCPRGPKAQFDFDESNLMHFSSGKFGVEGVVLIGLCTLFASIYFIILWSRNRKYLGRLLASDPAPPSNVRPKPNL